jgi:YbgC/YbaW family acyl-CoA thioester hydrolase
MPLSNTMTETFQTPTIPPARFEYRMRVRWAEVDMQKIVFNAHYLMYLDTAMAEYWRALALPYEETLAQCGGDLYVKKATVEYFASAHWDDALDIGLQCQRVGESSVVFFGSILCDGKLLATGELVYVFADPATQLPKPVPVSLRNALLGFEAGEPVLALAVGDWQSLGEAARAIRLEVFVQEQQIPLALEQDEQDVDALHVVASNRLGAPVATGRLLVAAPGVSKIGRVAVKRSLRGTGVGQMALQALVNAAKERGDEQVLLHAQASATRFYLAQGFFTVGEPFKEAGIEHIAMVKRL